MPLSNSFAKLWSKMIGSKEALDLRVFMQFKGLSCYRGYITEKEAQTKVPWNVFVKCIASICCPVTNRPNAIMEGKDI